MLTIKQTSEKLNVSASLVYALCTSGLIDHHRCGLGRGTIRIDEAALQVYIERTRIIVQSRPQGPQKGFHQLNSARLAAAWKQQGVGLPAQPPR